MKKIGKIVTMGIFCLAILGGCGNRAAVTEAETSPAEADREESTLSGEIDMEEKTQEASFDKKAILVVSFGTSYNETREKTIDVIEEKIADAYPDFEVRRAFTSQTIIDKLKTRDGLEIDNVQQAMQKLVDDGFEVVVVQPTHIMAGKEFEDMLEQVEPFMSGFSRAITGEPLLTYSEDFEATAKILVEETSKYNKEGTGVVFVGHGTEHDANAVYAALEEELAEQGADNYFVGTVEGDPAIEDVMSKVEAAGSNKVVLLPFMIVAGDHATNDLAGDGEDSWKMQFIAAGYETECEIRGLGEYPGIQDLIVIHVQDAMDFLRL